MCSASCNHTLFVCLHIHAMLQSYFSIYNGRIYIWRRTRPTRVSLNYVTLCVRCFFCVCRDCMHGLAQLWYEWEQTYLHWTRCETPAMSICTNSTRTCSTSESQPFNPAVIAPWTGAEALYWPSSCSSGNPAAGRCLKLSFRQFTRVQGIFLKMYPMLSDNRKNGFISKLWSREKKWRERIVNDAQNIDAIVEWTRRTFNGSVVIYA